MKTLTKAVLLTALIWLNINSACSQELITTAGGYFTGTNVTVSWSLGEPVIETFANGSIVLTQGFQQPFMNSYQILDIPSGWSGISTYINPSGKAVNGMFSDIGSYLIILQSMTGVYFPQEDINTIGNWNYKEGYKIKVSDPVQMVVMGVPGNKTVIIYSGWSLIPVLSSCVVSTDIFSQLSPQVEIVKEVAGNGVYWEEYGINTLQTLIPGKSYFIKMNSLGSLSFPSCDAKSSISAIHTDFPKANPWNEPVKTPNTHVIAVSCKGLQTGDIVGVFSSEGVCCGLTEIEQTNGYAGLVAYGKNGQSNSIHGLSEGESFLFRLYRPSFQNEYVLEVEYDQKLPNQNLFTDGGLTAVESTTLSIPSLFNILQPIISVYPNPNHGSFMVNVENVSSQIEISLLTSQGQQISFKTIEPGNREIIHEIDMPELPKGMYLLKVKTDSMIKTERVVVN